MSAATSRSSLFSPALSPAPGVARSLSSVAAAAPYLAASSLFGVGGQLLLKSAMSSLGPLDLAPAALPVFLLALLTHPLVLLGLLIYACGTLCWLLVLSRLALSVAYPFASLNYPLVLAAAWLLLGEAPTLPRLGGVAAIAAGLLCIGFSHQRQQRRLEPPAPGEPEAGS